jgi:hypothetical protein
MTKSSVTALKILGVGAIGAVAIFWLSTVYAIANFIFEFKTVKVHKLVWDSLLPELQLKFVSLITNTTSQPLEVVFVKAQVDIDGKVVGSATHAINQRLEKKYETKEIAFLFDVSLVSLGTTVVEAIRSGNYSGHTIGIKGFININGFDFDFNENLQLSA